MAVTEICPHCGGIGYPVNAETVNAISKTKTHYLNEHFYACTNPLCNIGYFSKLMVVEKSEIAVPLWYKDDSNAAYICYCSKITRGEIASAVKAGCQSIDDVQEYTKKNITGKCKRENPLGECCRNSFLFEIEKNK